MIHWELCKKFLFDHPIKWYIHNPESVLENETYKVLWYSEIQTGQLLSARQPELVIVKKKEKKKKNTKKENLPNSKLCRSGRPQSKIKRNEKRDKYLDLARELKKLRVAKVTVMPIVIGAWETIHEGLVKGPETWK